MTNLKESPQTNSLQTDIQNGQKSPSTEETQSSTPPTPASSYQKSMGLRGQLMLGIVPTVLVSLAVAGVAGWWVTRQNIQQQYRERIEKQSLLAGEAASQVLSNLQQIPESIASNPIVISAVREGTNKVQGNNLTSVPIQQIEQRYSKTKLINADPVLNTYLKQLAGPDQVAEMFITEKNGFNVAYNQPISDLVQSDENWWQQGKQSGEWLGDLQLNESSRRSQIPSVHAITDPESGEFLGMIKMGIPASAFEKVETYLNYTDILETGKVQVLEPSTGGIFTTVNSQGFIESKQIEGGEAVRAMAQAMVKGLQKEETSLRNNLNDISQQYEIQNLQLESYLAQAGERNIRLSFRHQGRNYEMSTVPKTDWVAVSSVDHQVLASAGNELIPAFVLTGLLLSGVAVGIAFLLARQLAAPLSNVSESAQKAAAGDLSVRAQPQGSQETQALAQSYNNLVEQVQQLLREQEETAQQQRREREELEEEVSRLMTDIENASEGDLTVRAQLMEGDIGIVADLFNAVVENLQDTARQVKDAASRVSTSLGENETAIRQLAEGAIEEADDIQSTLNSVEEMNRSIQEVADNAQKAASIADTAFTTAQEGNQAMEKTVQTIQGLRSTVGETSKKMKQMGESAQKISQVVSLIDEISLKTSLLAINASVEANRAGELGQGFTAVAEQVESLAEQSASAAKEISQIVANIQNDTQEAIETMEQGTTEVVESTRSVEETQARLGEVVARSEEINNLMQSISNSTVSQAETSQAVSQLMEQVTRSSQERSQTSKDVAEAIQETSEIAKRLESSVEQFKVDKDSTNNE
ncbi:MAG: methyl-accepting chemotaxis protein [Halothece sp.]